MTTFDADYFTRQNKICERNENENKRRYFIGANFKFDRESKSDNEFGKDELKNMTHSNIFGCSFGLSGQNRPIWSQKAKDSKFSAKTCRQQKKKA